AYGVPDSPPRRRTYERSVALAGVAEHDLVPGRDGGTLVSCRLAGLAPRLLTAGFRRSGGAGTPRSRGVRPRRPVFLAPPWGPAAPRAPGGFPPERRARTPPSPGFPPEPQEPPCPDEA